MPEETTERNPLAALLHGCSMLLLAIAGTLTTVEAVLAACGAGTGEWLIVFGLLAAAGMLHGYSRLTRTSA